MSTTTSLTLATPSPTRERSRLGWWSRFARNRIAAAGLLLLFVIGVVALVGPLFVASPTKQNVAIRFQKPSADHW